MTTDQKEKIARRKLSLLQLAWEFGNVSGGWRTVGCSQDSFWRFRELHGRGGMAASEKFSRCEPV